MLPEHLWEEMGVPRPKPLLLQETSDTKYILCFLWFFVFIIFIHFILIIQDFKLKQIGISS